MCKEKDMRVALPSWSGRISPVFDVARVLILVDTDAGVEIKRKLYVFQEEDLSRRTIRCSLLGIQVLICGAISHSLKTALEAKNIEVIEQICGDTEQVLQAYLNDELIHPSYFMPGCRRLRQELLCHIKKHQSLPRQRRNGMKIAITSQGEQLSSKIDPRFGRARFLIFYDSATKHFKVHDNSRNLTVDHGAGIRVAKMVLDESADVLITGQIGPKAQQALEFAHIQVLQGYSGTVEEALRQLEPRHTTEPEKSVTHSSQFK
jgi:predicted Fe-Mo cluster-binding NifX family protein